MKIPLSESSVIVLVDMQEKLLRVMTDPDTCSAKCITLLRGAAAFGIPVIVTEQYPKGLGPTVSGIAEVLPAGTPVVEKGSFSCFGAEAFADEIAKRAPETMILCGIESHVCVAQTALDAANRGMQVFVVRDAVTSRHASDRDSVFPFLQANGIQVIPLESLLFLLLRTSKHPAFKEISKLIR